MYKGIWYRSLLGQLHVEDYQEEVLFVESAVGRRISGIGPFKSQLYIGGHLEQVLLKVSFMQKIIRNGSFCRITFKQKDIWNMSFLKLVVGRRASGIYPFYSQLQGEWHLEQVLFTVSYRQKGIWNMSFSQLAVCRRASGICPFLQLAVCRRASGICPFLPLAVCRRASGICPL